MGGQKERRKLKSVYGKPKKKTKIQVFLTSFGLGTPDPTPQEKWDALTKEEKQQRIQELWERARRYGNKLRFESRLRKMADSNLKEMMIDDINEDANDANLVADSQDKIKWYLIDTEKSFCKVWNFMISILIIYELFVVPFVLVFPDIYNTITIKPVSGQQNLFQEFAADVNNVITGTDETPAEEAEEDEVAESEEDGVSTSEEDGVTESTDDEVAESTDEVRRRRVLQS